MIEQHRLLNEDRRACSTPARSVHAARRTLTPINAANLRKAHERLESGTMIGKLVLGGVP